MKNNIEEKGISEKNEKKNRKMLPVILLRDMVIMPGTSIHFDIQRKDSICAIQAAMEQDQEMFAVMAKSVNTNDIVTEEQIYQIGTLVKVKQVLKMPKDHIRVLFMGEERASLDKLVYQDEYYKADAVQIIKTFKNMEQVEEDARLRTLKDILKQCGKRQLISNPVTLDALEKVKDLELLIDLATEAAPMPIQSKQKILECVDLANRTEELLALLLNEISIADIRAELGEKLKDCVSENQREYVLREQMKVIRKELGEENTEEEGEHYFKRLNEIHPPEEVRQKIEKEIKRFCSLSYSSAESAVIRNYIETVLDYPWSTEKPENRDLKMAADRLEKDHYGLKDIKERIIDYLAVRNLSGRKDAPIICLVGPPGTGKTSIAKSVAMALHKEYGRIALGGSGRGRNQRASENLYWGNARENCGGNCQNRRK